MNNYKYISIISIPVQIFLTSSSSYSQNQISHDKSPFNQSVVFGDSLSDNGFFPDWATKTQGSETTNGRFSNGSVWDEYLFLGQKRGTKFSIFGSQRNGDYGAQTENRDVNVNYSIGGSTYLPNDSFYSPTIEKQIDDYINGTNTFSATSIVTLWAGANDALDAMEKGTSVTDKAEIVKGKLSEALERLYENGARHFLLPDMPDFSKVPRFINSGSPFSHQAAEAFNNAIAESISAFKSKHPDANVYAPDMTTLLDTVGRHADLFGYQNTTEACVKVAACKSAAKGSAIQNEFMFWDEIHPTTRTHNYIANYIREYWQNPDLAGFYVVSPQEQYETERNYFFPITDKKVAGYLTGKKALYKLNTGKLTLIADHSYTGGTFIKEGELELGNGGETGSVIGDVEVAEQTALSFNRNNTLNFSQKITGNGNVIQKGRGLTILTGDNTYNGSTDIRAGEMMVNGSITSKVFVYSGGTLSGQGIIGGFVADNGAFVAPGDFRSPDIGTLIVNGDIQLKQGSMLDISVESDGSTSALNASGSAVLRGSVIFNHRNRRVPLTVNETLAFLDKNSTFMKASNGIDGRFEKVEPTYRFIGAELDYRQNEVNVAFTQTGRRFAEDATTVNQRAVADAVQALRHGNQLYDNIAVSTYNDNLSGAYTQLTGDIYASLQTSLLLDGNLTRDTIHQRMINVFDDHAVLPSQGLNAPLDNSVWGQIYSSNARWSSDSNATSMKRSLTGFITGIDTRVTNDWQLGIFTGYMRSSINSGLSSASIDSYQLGAYGGREWNNFKLSIGVSGSLHEITSSRSFSFKEINNSNEADFRGNSLQTFAELGYAVVTPLAKITPFAGLSYTRVKADAFAENPTATALSGDSNKVDAFSTLLGLRLGQNYALSDRVTLDLNFMTAWQNNSHERPSADLNFSGGNTFKTTGLPLQRDALILKTGLQLNWQQNTSLGVFYEGQLGNEMKDNTLKADFTIRF